MDGLKEQDIGDLKIERLSPATASNASTLVNAIDVHVSRITRICILKSKVALPL